MKNINIKFAKHTILSSMNIQQRNSTIRVNKELIVNVLGENSDIAEEEKQPLKINN
jgi:hypothetical protein